MKILITGAAGYLGSVLTPQLLKEGNEVTALDKFMYNQSSLLDCCCDEKLKVVRGDARERDLMARLIKDADVVIPLACLTGAPLCDKDPISARTTNLDAIKLVMELRGKDQKVVFPTTNSGYGTGIRGEPANAA